MSYKQQRDRELEASSAEILRLRQVLLADRTTLQEIVRLSRSSAPNKDEIEQRAMDGVAAIDRALHAPRALRPQDHRDS